MRGQLAALGLLVALAPHAGAEPAWQAAESGTRAALFGVSYYVNALAEKLPWVVGEGGTLLLGGADGLFYALKAPSGADLFDAATADGKTLLAVGAKGIALVSTDSGASWKKSSTGSTRDLRGVFVSASGAALAVGSGGVILRSDDAGKSWKELRQKGLPAVELRAVSGRATFGREAKGKALGAAYVAGDEGVLLRLLEDGSAWEQVETGTRAALHGIAAYDACQAYAVGDGGTGLSSKDCGKTWRAFGPPTTEDLRRVVVETDYRVMKPRIQITSAQGTLFTSSDEGRSWTSQALGAPLADYTAGPAGPFAVGEAGLILRPGEEQPVLSVARKLEPAFTVAEIKSSGGLSSGYAGSSLSSFSANFCYKLALTRDPALQGDASFKVSVLPAGEVFAVEVVKGLEKGLDECLREQLSRLTFKAAASGMPSEVTFTVRLYDRGTK